MPDYSKRMKEFVWYHIHGDGDCNGQVLKVYSEMGALSDQEKFDLAYFYSITYCCASAVFLLDHRDLIRNTQFLFADQYKHRLLFQSDRKYVRMLDNFYRVLSTWVNLLDKHAQDFHDRFVKGNTIDTKAALSECEKWYFFSRFSAYLFVETYCDIFGLEGSLAYDMAYEGDSMTFASGLFYVYGMDEEARYIQKHHELPVDNYVFESLIAELQEEVRKNDGDDNFTKLETSLCAYDKMFKGTRYNGYYADRQLEEVVKMRKEPEFREACDAILKARKMAIPKRYRGEDNGWYGIRKEEKKSYRQNGRISYCPYQTGG